MGTNFYVEDEPTCNNPTHIQTLHIGKRSGGWKFGFHAIPDHEPPLTSWAAWQDFLPGRTVTDEYGDSITGEEFIQIIKDWMADPHQTTCRLQWLSDRGYKRNSDEYHDAEGNDFYEGDFS